jgi:DNA-binding NarL/FixJ family response regulator
MGWQVLFCEKEDEGTVLSALDVIAQRVRPQIVMLKDDYSVALAEWDTGIDLFRSLGLEAPYARRLLPAIENEVREIAERLELDPDTNCVFSTANGLVVRVSLLASADSKRILLYIEPSRRREDLLAAASRFNLTQRQLEVLSYLLQGLTARQIAETLGIAETTVGDYFKQLLLRTKARNRADMIARVLNWGSQTAANPPGKRVVRNRTKR